MPAPLLPQVVNIVGQTEADAQQTIDDATALVGYVAQTYNSDTQLQQLADNVLADANTVSQDLGPLTNWTVNPPAPRLAATTTTTKTS